MIVEKEINNIQKFGATDSITCSVKQDSTKLLHLLSNLYSDSLGAVIREISTNCVDAHVYANKKDVPFTIILPNSLNSNVMSFIDYGDGLTPSEVKEILGTYCESTKEKSNDFIGCLGVGSKSPFSISNTYNFISRIKPTINYQLLLKKDPYTKENISSINNWFLSTQYFYIHSKDTATMEHNIDLFGFSNSIKPTGCSVEVPIKYELLKRVKSSIIQQLKFFEIKPNIIGDTLSFNSTIKTKYQKNPKGNFKRLSKDSYIINSVDINAEESYVVQGIIGYKFNKYDFLNSAKSYIFDKDILMEIDSFLSEYSFEIYAELGSVQFAPSREFLIYDKKTTLIIFNSLANMIYSLKKELTKVLTSSIYYSNHINSRKGYFFKDLNSLTSKDKLSIVKSKHEHNLYNYKFLNLETFISELKLDFRFKPNLNLMDFKKSNIGDSISFENKEDYLIFTGIQKELKKIQEYEINKYSNIRKKTQSNMRYSQMQNSIIVIMKVKGNSNCNEILDYYIKLTNNKHNSLFLWYPEKNSDNLKKSIKDANSKYNFNVNVLEFEKLQKIFQKKVNKNMNKSRGCKVQTERKSSKSTLKIDKVKTLLSQEKKKTIYYVLSSIDRYLKLETRQNIIHDDNEFEKLSLNNKITYFLRMYFDKYVFLGSKKDGISHDAFQFLNHLMKCRNINVDDYEIIVLSGTELKKTISKSDDNSKLEPIDNMFNLNKHEFKRFIGKFIKFDNKTKQGLWFNINSFRTIRTNCHISFKLKNAYEIDRMYKFINFSNMKPQKFINHKFKSLFSFFDKMPNIYSSNNINYHINSNISQFDYNFKMLKSILGLTKLTNYRDQYSFKFKLHEDIVISDQEKYKFTEAVMVRRAIEDMGYRLNRDIPSLPYNEIGQDSDKIINRIMDKQYDKYSVYNIKDDSEIIIDKKEELQIIKDIMHFLKIIILEKN